jgi:DNA-binding HxlR family transcriptional regulator
MSWRRPIRIDTDRYETVSRAILSALGREPMRFAELAARVARLLPRFAGSVTWYTLTCARELERRGRIRRTPKPVRYARGAVRRSSARPK